MQAFHQGPAVRAALLRLLLCGLPHPRQHAAVLVCWREGGALALPASPPGACTLTMRRALARAESAAEAAEEQLAKAKKGVADAERALEREKQRAAVREIKEKEKAAREVAKQVGERKRELCGARRSGGGGQERGMWQV